MEEQNSRNRRAIIVLGMHRSGTSALTRVINLCGVDLGSNLMPPIPDSNEKGFWESSDIFQLNELILEELNSSWDDVRNLPDQWWDTDIAERYKKEVLKILKRDFAESKFWGIKDPRLCRLLPKWHNILESMKCEPYFINIVRNPLEVAASLEARDGFPKEKSCQLWINHILESEKATRNSARIYVTYEELISNYSGILSKAEEYFGFNWPVNLEKAGSEIEAFLESRLRHSIYTDDDLLRDYDVSDWIKKAYFAIADSIYDSSNRIIEILDIISSERNRVIKKIGPVSDAQDWHIRYLALEASQLRAELSKVNMNLVNMDKELKEFRDQLSERNETVNKLSTRLAEFDKNEIRLQQSIDEVNHIKNSNSWKLTRPLRITRRFVITLYHGVRISTSTFKHFFWHNLPIPTKARQSIKRSLFKTFPFIFRHTSAYRTWVDSEYECETDISSTLPNLPVLSLTAMIEAKVQCPISDPLKALPIRLIAFYLPQFHPIPENDEWWGEGFTDWTNVKHATPMFSFHQQPNIPGELGYYDLRDPKVLRRQVELAKLYGIGGFCFYFYWFAGKTLLESPLRQYLENRELDLPFCLCWANENWSRRWDGLDDEILIAQDHSADDDLAFIEYISPYLRDPRYIRIQGKPLLAVYRPKLLPSAKKTVKRWRDWCWDNDIGDIYLAYTQSFEFVDPHKYGFDGAIEFPPNESKPPIITDRANIIESDFSGVIYDWRCFLKRSEKYKQPNYPLFRSVCPGWDNTPRRKNKAHVFVGSTPQKYRTWLENAALDTISRFSNPSDRMVFVNAWNEWAEGAYLEPDQKYGYAYLQSTRDALERVNNWLGTRRLILVAHDAHPHGAQYNILNMAKMLAEDFGFVLDMFVLGDGPLIEYYGKYATLHLLYGKDVRGKDVKALLAGLFAEGVRSAIANTTVTGIFVKVLKEQGFHVVSLIHELPGVIKKQKLQSHVQSIAESADSIVFAAKTVMEGFECFSPNSLHQAVIRPQGLYKKNLLQNPNQIEAARKELRSRFGLAENSKIVLCVGFADYRKGIDLFVEIGLKVLRRNTNVYFIWVGHFDSTIETKIRKLVDGSKFSRHFIFPGHDSATDLYYAGSDVYALTSREDPFPSVVLESFDASLPVFAFDGVGGANELLSRGCGRLIPAYDTTIFATELIELLQSPQKICLLGKSGKAIVESEFSMRHYMFDLVALAEEPIKRVSVIVPNYNYANFLVERIMSIVNQSYPIYEIIILDDASDDESIQNCNDLMPELKIDCKLITNEINSGNPFVQWLKGVRIARGDYVWIAEADDLSEPTFLSEVVQPFDDPTIVLSYCQSKQMGSDCRILCDDYLDYVSDISPEKWKKQYVQNGIDEIYTSLAIKNTIPNVSSVVFDKNTLLKILEERIDEIKAFNIAGDWVTYIYILEYGKIAYSPKSLNLHRRHQNSVTISNFNLSHLKEILAVQQKVRNRFKLCNEAIVKAHEYSQSLYDCFNLATPEVAKIDEHPILKTYLKN